MELWEILFLSAAFLFVLIGVLTGVVLWKRSRGSAEDGPLDPMIAPKVDTSEMRLPASASKPSTIRQVWDAFHRAKDDDMTVLLAFNTMRAHWDGNGTPEDGDWRIGVPAHEAHLLQEFVSPDGYQLKMHPQWEDHERNEDETDALFTDGHNTLYINLVYMGPGVYPRATPPTPFYADANEEEIEAFTGMLKGGMVLRGKVEPVRFQGQKVWTYGREMMDVFNREEGWTNPVADGFW